MTVSKKTFKLSGKNACITGRKNKEKYLEYQDSYRAEFGVYPELDIINNPFKAKWDDVYVLCCELRKSGVYGALYYHDLHARYRKRLKKIYETRSNEWSFLLTIDLDNRTTFNDIPLMVPGEHIVNNLGYRVDGQGNYYEGTWKNDKLIYGLVYLADSEIFYVGSFDESGKTDCYGVSINIEKKNSKVNVTTTAGTFRYKNGNLVLHSDVCLINIARCKDDSLLSIDSYAGQYEDGYAEGTFLNKEISDEIRIRWDKYKEGDIKFSMSSIEMLPRTLMMFYMLVWYLVKYIYGSIFPVTLLYYYFRKKNWKM